MNNEETNCWIDRPRLIAIAQRILGNKHDAEDVVQETLLAIWKLNDQIDPLNKTRYLNRAIRQNAIKRRIRQKSHHPLDNCEHNSNFAIHIEIEPIDLEEAIQSLPEGQQQVIRMRYYAGMSFAEISKSLTISLHTAASRCRYAIDKLKEFFRKGRKQ